jgi:hypothetical protein
MGSIVRLSLCVTPLEGRNKSKNSTRLHIQSEDPVPGIRCLLICDIFIYLPRNELGQKSSFSLPFYVVLVCNIESE